MEWPLQSFPEHHFDEADYLATHREKFKIVGDLLAKERPAKVLDIGAGTGTIYSLLPSLEGLEIHAIEIVPDFVAVLKERGIHGHRFDLDKGEPFPFPDESFDIVVCDSILEHTLKPRYLLEESRRVLKRGGTLVLIVPNATSARRRWGHLRGRNVFYPLIDNLFSRPYLLRCSIFYSPEDLAAFAGRFFSIQQVSFFDETHHDEKALSVKACRMLSTRIPALRDVIIMECIKSNDLPSHP